MAAYENSKDSYVLVSPVTFHVEFGKHGKKTTVQDLFAKAEEADNANGTDAPEGGYTVEQAFQVVWHHEPEWLHANVLIGWTYDQKGLWD